MHMGNDLHFTKHLESNYLISRFQIDTAVYRQGEMSPSYFGRNEEKKLSIFFLGVVDTAYLIDKLISLDKLSIDE